MWKGWLARLLADESGKGLIKFSLGTCIVATAFAMASPNFTANPLMNGKIHEFRNQLPETLDAARRAMGGH